MKTKRPNSIDADLANVGAALRRAADNARRLAEQTGTPFYVFQDGRIINLNPQPADPYALRESGKSK
jgi:protein-disulfide isomerase